MQELRHPVSHKTETVQEERLPGGATVGMELEKCELQHALQVAITTRMHTLAGDVPRTIDIGKLTP